MILYFIDTINLKKEILKLQRRANRGARSALYHTRSGRALGYRLAARAAGMVGQPAALQSIERVETLGPKFRCRVYSLTGIGESRLMCTATVRSGSSSSSPAAAFTSRPSNHGFRHAVWTVGRRWSAHQRMPESESLRC